LKTIEEYASGTYRKGKPASATPLDLVEAAGPLPATHASRNLTTPQYGVRVAIRESW
jgi:hypothetical protein